jgi:hypothetical protein
VQITLSDSECKTLRYMIGTLAGAFKHEGKWSIGGTCSTDIEGAEDKEAERLLDKLFGTESIATKFDPDR